MWLVATSTVPGNLPFRLEEGEYVLGRSKKAQIVIADTTVSRRHGRLVCTRNGLTIEDLDSYNGAFLNEVPITERHLLQVGDRVRLGMVACLISRSPLLIHAGLKMRARIKCRGPEVIPRKSKRLKMAGTNVSSARSWKTEGPDLDSRDARALNDACPSAKLCNRSEEANHATRA